MKRSLLPLAILSAALFVMDGSASADQVRVAVRVSSCDRGVAVVRREIVRPVACLPACRVQPVTDMRPGHFEYRTVPVLHAGYWQCRIDPWGRRQNHWVPGYYVYNRVSTWVPDAPCGTAAYCARR